MDLAKESPRLEEIDGVGWSESPSDERGKNLDLAILQCPNDEVIEIEAGLPVPPSERCPINPPIESKTEPNDQPYSAFREWEKKSLIFMVGFAAMISPFASGSYYPAVNELSRDLGVSVTLINLTISTYQIFQGIAPSVTAAISEKYGRRPAYMLCFIVFFGANLGLALQDDYTALLVLRCVQSSGSSGTVSLGQGVVSDLSTRAERGQNMAWATIGATLGPAFGPVVGGLLSQYLGWRAIFWFLLILGGILGTIMAVVFPETSRAAVGNGSVPPARWNRSLVQVIHEDVLHEPHPRAEVETLEKSERYVNPFRSVQILFHVENSIIVFYAGILFAGYLSVTAVLSSQLHARFGFNEVQIGLCYIPLGIGSLTSRWTMAFLVDWNFKRQAKKQGLDIIRNRQQDISKFNVEKARLMIAMPAALGACCMMVAYGWAMEFHAPLAAILVILFFTAHVLTGSLIPIGTLLLDLNKKSAASAGAAVNLVRCSLSAGAVAAATPLINAIGIGWTASLTAFIWIALLPVVWLVYHNGYRWRVAKEANHMIREEKVMATNPS